MPGLSVTFWQAMRLWDLDQRVRRAVLDALVQGGFLTRRATARSGESEVRSCRSQIADYDRRLTITNPEN